MNKAVESCAAGNASKRLLKNTSHCTILQTYRGEHFTTQERTHGREESRFHIVSDVISLTSALTGRG